jgi:hypothetical protein
LLVLMPKPLKPNDLLPAAIQSEGGNSVTPAKASTQNLSAKMTGDRFGWEHPWSSAGESEPGWWRAFALDKDVRATRTPDRFIKKPVESNVVALPTSEAMDAVRLARAADKSCKEAIHRRLEGLRNAVQARSPITPVHISGGKSPPAAEVAEAALRVDENRKPAPAPSLPSEVVGGAILSVANSPHPDEGSDSNRDALSGRNSNSVGSNPDDEEGTPKLEPAILLPVPVKAVPTFAGFAFLSSLYKITVSSKPILMIELSIHGAASEDLPSNQSQDIPLGKYEPIGLGDVSISELPKVVPEQHAENFDPGYLALYGEEIASVSALVKAEK